MSPASGTGCCLSTKMFSLQRSFSFVNSIVDVQPDFLLQRRETHDLKRKIFTRMYQHKEADRIPIVDLPWAGTFRRWHREGMPENVEWTEYFDIDKTAGIGCDITPRYEHRIIEETDDYVIYTTAWGATQKSFKKEDSSPEFIDFKVNTSEAWLDAKRRMTVDRQPHKLGISEEASPSVGCRRKMDIGGILVRI
jgi:hypothetical protein